jgi:aspartyl-tRNA(Asn)/glutamyl-tRNA(Gln) amidotransferase subunit B
MRSKEEAHDYRYFPEPDLVPMVPDPKWVEEIKASLPELPGQKKKRFLESYGLPDYDASMLAEERQVAEWFEEVVKLGGAPKAASNWMMGEFMRLLNDDNTPISESKVTPKHLADMLSLIDNDIISGKIAKSVFEKMYRTGKNAHAIVEEEGLVQVSDTGELGKVIDKVIANSQREVGRYKTGEVKLFGFFVGQVMKETKGKGNPKLVNDLLRKKLESN